ncbi:hypothetical protein PUN4_550207 [Paraburkholderia unamae]|nr:hypothetical protein PUN4_550207 [Paraburkholderia unamae]
MVEAIDTEARANALIIAKIERIDCAGGEACSETSVWGL